MSRPSFLPALVLTVGLVAVPCFARAADATVTLDIHHAGCVLCGPIVKSSLVHVQGVKSVTVSQPNAMADVTAIVVYNPAVTRVATLIRTVTDRGYPATVEAQTTS
ncbi:MAG: heavy-metal-associated domain-containing protein [Steroidobacteraceae bacterium]